jgi:hypothetical protein
MTKEALRARIVELTALRDSHLGQANAAQGAVEECGFWLAKLEQSDEQLQNQHSIGNP